MKKIGIMTMHRVINYGSFLQAFGLKQILEELGYKVQLVDYNIEPPIIKTKKKNLLQRIIKNINILGYIKKKNVLNKFKREYNHKYLKLLNIKKYNYNPNIDTLIIGSDEVFNCLQDYPIGYSKELFGKNYEKINVISYAASFGHTTLEELKKYKIDREIGKMLCKFKEVSVRDKNSYDIVKKISTNSPVINLDPVLISSFYKYETNNVKLKNYIIVYAYPGRLAKDEEKYIKSFAKKNKKKIVCLGMYQKIADYNLVVSPFEVLEYFKKADYIITDTFHGTIFSIINHSKYCTIIRESNKNKLEDLLERLEQGNRKVQELEEIEILYNKEIDFEQTNKIIANERKKTIEYLKNNLK